MDDEVVVINSDSEDEDAPPPRPKATTSSRYAEEGLSTYRRAEENRRRQRYTSKHFPFIQEFEPRFREILRRPCQRNVIKLITAYVGILQDCLSYCPVKSRVLARCVARKLYLFRSFSKDFRSDPFYLQKICQLIGIYIIMELNNANVYKDSGTEIAERIISIIHLQLKNADQSYILKIFGYIPKMTKQSDLVPKLFRRLIPEPIVMLKHEFSDRLYIQYLIAFYHWKESEAIYDDQQKVISFANRFMKPMRTLKSSIPYAQHLPCYEKREDATGYFLSNMVFFNDLRNASLLDGIRETCPTNMIDLTDDMDGMTIGFAQVDDDDDDDEQAEGTAECPIEVPDEVLWMKQMVLRANELEVKLPALMASNLNTGDVINLDSSDDENDRGWTYNEDELAARQNDSASNTEDAQTVPAQQTTDSTLTTPTTEESQDSFQTLCCQLGLPHDGANDPLRQITQDNPPSRVQNDATTNSLDENHLTFRGITDNATTSCLPSSSSSTSSPCSSSSTIPMETSETPAPEVVASTSKSIPIETNSRIEEPMDTLPQESQPEPISMETDIIEEPTTREEQSMEDELSHEIGTNSIESNVTAVANILAGFSEASTSLNGSSSYDDNQAPLDSIIDNTQVEKEAVTLSLNTYTSTYESSEESDETFLSHYEKPPIKTYLRKAFKKSEMTTTPMEEEPIVDKNENNNNNTKDADDTTPQETTKQTNDAVNGCVPNVLFSEKVIQLREDVSAIGGLTPSYLKVPESVEVSQQRPIVIFSLNGLSSFPSLQAASPNEQNMPDFDNDFFNEHEESFADKEEENKTTESKPVAEKTPTPSVEINEKPKAEAEKPTTSRRSVWWSDKNEIREIPPRETPASSKESSQSTINTLTSTINNINATKQQYRPSTPPTSQTDFKQFTINNTSTNFLRRTISPNTTATTTSTITNNANATTSPDTAALKSAQEKDLVQRLFPELFNAGVKQQNKNKFNKNINLVRSPAASPNHCSINNHNSTIIYNNIQNENRRKSGTPTLRLRLGGFDKYLSDLHRRNAKRERSSADGSSTKKRRGRKSRNPNKLSIDVHNDEKLKMIPVVVIERLSETIYRAKRREMKRLKRTSQKGKSSLLRATGSKDKCTELTRTVPPIEYLCAIAVKETSEKIENGTKMSTIQVAPKTSSELRLIAPTEKDGDVLPLDIKTSNERIATDTVPKSEIKIRPVETVQVQEKPVEDKVEPPPPEPEKVPVGTVSKALPVEMMRPIKLEEPDVDFPRMETFKKPVKSYTSRARKTTKTPPFKTVTSSEVKDVSIESPADRLAAAVSKSTKQMNRNLSPPNTKNTNKIVSSLEPTETSGTPNVDPAHITTTKEVKVKLKRCNFMKGYVVVANTAVDDLIRDGKDPAQLGLLDEVNLQNCDEKRPRKEKQKRGSQARKMEAIQRVYPSSSSSSILFVGPRNRRTFGENHLICINTPPPTPPSPSLSPAPASSDANTATDDTSQDGFESNAHRPTVEPNNNHVQPTFPPSEHQNASRSKPELSKLFSSSSDMIQEFCDHANLPREVEINQDFLLLYYEYLAKRKDDRAIKEMTKVLPLFERKLFDSSMRPYRQRRRFESCSSPSLNQQRARKHSISESPTHNAGCSSWTNKRRKTICSDSHFLTQSPDFLFDEEICSSPKPADSPTLEVMRLHTAKRSVQPKAIPSSTIVSSCSSSSAAAVVEEENEEFNVVEIEIQTTPVEDVPIRSPNLFSDSPLTAHIPPPRAAPTPIQADFFMENTEEEEKCGNSSSPLTRRTNCDSPPEIASRMVVSRTYSKSNMVQHVFVPPEIEKCIEEQSVVVEKAKEAEEGSDYAASTATVSTSNISMPSTSSEYGTQPSRSSCRKKRKIPKYFTDNTSDDGNNDNDTDDTYKVDDDEDEEKCKEMKPVATTSVKRTRRKTKTSRRRKRLRKH